MYEVLYLSIVEESIENLVEEDDWTEQEIQQSQHAYPEPQSMEERERGCVRVRVRVCVGIGEGGD